MRIITVSGPPSAGKTSVILKAAGLPARAGECGGNRQV